MKKQHGFTLVELMIVVVIIGILASLAIPRFMGATDKAKLAEFKPILKQAVILYNSYYQENGTYKTPTGGIVPEKGNPEIGFDLPGGKSRFTYSADESEDGVVVTATLNENLKGYKEGAAADLNQDFEKNTHSKGIPW